MRSHGGVITHTIRVVPRPAVQAATAPFTVQLPDKAFGPHADDIVVLPFARPALLKKTYANLKPMLGARRAMLRPDVVVIFGKQTTAQTTQLILSCIGPPK
jgi:hypothetical protein